MYFVYCVHQVLVSAGHYMESIEVAGGQVEIVGSGNMQHILLDAPAGSSALILKGGAVRISNMMLRSNRSVALPPLSFLFFLYITLPTHITLRSWCVACGKLT